MRRIVVVKNTGSALFDEAYFVVRSGKDVNDISTDTMESEARKILDDKLIVKEVKKVNKGTIRNLLCFIIGAMTSATVLYIIYMFHISIS